MSNASVSTPTSAPASGSLPSPVPSAKAGAGGRSLTGGFTPEAFAEQVASHSATPAWWVDRKREAYARFAALPLPSRTDEPWRFSAIGSLTVDGFRVPAPARAHAAGPRAREETGAATQPEMAELGLAPAATLDFLNNRLGAPGTGLPAELAAQGVVVAPLSQALHTHGELLRKHFMAQAQRLASDKFAALHTAFVGDGAFIYLPRGVELARPIVISHRAQGAGTAVFPHTLVVAEEGARVTVIDRFGSVDGTAQFAVGANDLYAGHGAQITYVGVQDWSRPTLSFQLNSTVVRRDARVQSLNLHLGARQARHESMSQLQAPGAFSEMLALTIADAEREFDQRTLQLHQAPNTKSDLLYKNVLLDRARTIFSGLIIVDPDAQKTDAYQSNRNLILSEDAEANSLPGLEIQANDVRCTHGATTARIDPEQAYYLSARGIPRAQAEELLIFGFFEEVLDRLQNADLHAALTALIRAKFKVKPSQVRPV
jgi:Fe-S cluster assembly protein SufD